jgi:glycosyltransferase involved in cell wall biosynthesis
MEYELPLSIIVSVRNNASSLAKTLCAILGSDLRRDQFELIVVDDASDDNSAETGARFADTVVRLTGQKSGNAYARNRGAELAQGEFLAFVDTDVVVRADTFSRMLAILNDNRAADAVSASHASSSEPGNLVSLYRNVLLYFGDSRNGGTDGNIGSPCSLIRRKAFISAGMFDEWRFDSAQVEGIDFGHRLESGGRQIQPAQGLEVHLVRATTIRSLCAEVWNRSALVARSLGYQRTRRTVPGDMVFTLSQSAAPAFAVLCIIAGSGAFVPAPAALTKIAIFLSGAVALSFRDYVYFAKTRGIVFVLAIAPLHLLMQTINGAGLCAGWLLRDAIGDRVPDAATQAYAEVGVETWPPVKRMTAPGQR